MQTKINNSEKIYDQKDEIILKDMLLFLFDSKWIIFSITSLITVISIVYVMLITPIYEATISIQPPSNLVISKINNSRFRHDKILPSSKIDTSKEELYNMVLYKLSLNSFKERVFISNNYAEKINLNKEDNDSPILSFVEKVKPFKDVSGLMSFALKGGDPLIISNFLNDLVRTASSDTLSEINNIEQNKINSRMKFIDIELNLEKENIQKTRLLKIIQLQKELKIAKSLKNKEFNFPQISQIGNNSLKSHPSQQKVLPIWYMYGEQALHQELDKLISNKRISSSKIDSLESQKALLVSVNPIIDNIEIVGVLWSNPPKGPISPKKRLIVSVMFFISLIISIFVAFLISVIREK